MSIDPERLAKAMRDLLPNRSIAISRNRMLPAKDGSVPVWEAGTFDDLAREIAVEYDKGGCERCGKPHNGEHFGLCCSCVEHGQQVQDVTEARHQIVIDAARDVTARVPGAMRRLRAAVALRDGDEVTE